MSEKCLKARLRRLLELIDVEAHRQNTSIPEDSYVKMVDELLAAHKEISKAETDASVAPADQLTFTSKILNSDMSVRPEHLCEIDSFVDSVESIRRVKRNIEHYKRDKLKWEVEPDVRILHKYEEDAVLFYLVSRRSLHLDLRSFKVECLKSIGFDIDDAQKFLERQFLRLSDWYDKELQLEIIGLQSCWSDIKSNWSEYTNIFKFINRTYKCLKYARLYGKLYANHSNEDSRVRERGERQREGEQERDDREQQEEREEGEQQEAREEGEHQEARKQERDERDEREQQGTASEELATSVMFDIQKLVV